MPSHYRPRPRDGHARHAEAMPWAGAAFTGERFRRASAITPPHADDSLSHEYAIAISDRRLGRARRHSTPRSNARAASPAAAI